MSGVAYLHESGIVHGDLKGVRPMNASGLSLANRLIEQSNILVDEKGIVRLADFGLMTILIEHSSIPLSASAVSSAGTVRWMSPELLFGRNSPPTRQSDCYALGMVVYEVGLFHSRELSFTHLRQVLTGLRPFYHLSTFSVVIAVQKGKLPMKPCDAEVLGLSKSLWMMMLRSWDGSPTVRPTAQQFLRYFEGASHTWVPPSAYPTTDCLDGEAELDFSFGEEGGTVKGALARVLFVVVVSVLWMLSPPIA